MTPRAVLAATGVLDVLCDGALGEVAVRVRDGAYLRLAGGGWVLLAGPRAVMGPLSLLVAGVDWTGCRPGDPVHVDGHVLRLGGVDVGLGTASTHTASIPAAVPDDGWRDALRAALGVVPPPPAALGPGLRAMADGDAATAVALLAGRGEGLTPAGDDCLAGGAAWRAASGTPVRWSALDAAGGCAPLGRAYLECAERGRLAVPAAAVLDAVRRGRAALASRRATALSGWGASSGAALLWGMAAASGWGR